MALVLGALSIFCALPHHHRAAGFGADDVNAGLLPPWPPTYNMSLSTFLMPCNYSGFFDPAAAALYGIVDFDWSNNKKTWAAQKPMDCAEKLVDQAAMIKAINPHTRVFGLPQSGQGVAVVHRCT
jgi:hypothetical protein